MSPLSVKLDMHYNGEVISTLDDRRLVGQIPFKDRTVSRTHINIYSLDASILFIRSYFDTFLP